MTDQIAGPTANGTVQVRRLSGPAPGGRLGMVMRDPSGSVRWSLARVWPRAKGTRHRRLVWVMLNPSRADHQRDDATVRRCIGYAEREGCNSIAVVNLVPVVSAYPGDMLAALPSYGRAWWHGHNAEAIRGAVVHAEYEPLVAVGWGAHGARPELAAYRLAVINLLHGSGITPYCLGVTSGGEPVHPLRQRADAPLTSWSPRA